MTTGVSFVPTAWRSWQVAMSAVEIPETNDTEDGSEATRALSIASRDGCLKSLGWPLVLVERRTQSVPLRAMTVAAQPASAGR